MPFVKKLNSPFLTTGNGMLYFLFFSSHGWNKGAISHIIAAHDGIATLLYKNLFYDILTNVPKRLICSNKHYRYS